jgi:5,10-methylene-tetrahydrofolate dehydrogenase/methenyl tetrahydrofolate cyclohydrolase
MTQSDKDLLLKDLCARLPYFTKVQIKNEIAVLNSICDDDGFHFNFIGYDKEGVNIENIKVYVANISKRSICSCTGRGSNKLLRHIRLRPTKALCR